MKKFACALAAVAMATPSARAQSLQDLTLDRSGEMRVSAGLTIPLGKIRQKPLEKPRFDLSLAHRIRSTSDVQLARWSLAEEEKLWRSTSFSFTLEDNPRLLMNGVALSRPKPVRNADNKDQDEDEEGGIDSGLLIGGLAAAALVGLTIVATTDLRDALNDFDNPD